MLSLKKIVADIRNIADSGENNYSFRISDEQFAFWVHEVRSMLISQAIGKRQDISDIWVQSIPCLELVEVDVVESPFVPATGCYFLKGKHPIPTMLEGLPIQVTTVAPDCKNCDKEIREFTYVPWPNFQYAVNSRIEAQNNSLYYTIKNYGSKTDLYIYTNSKYDSLKAVALTLIPKNPIEVTNFPKCGEDVSRSCSYLTDKFIIDHEIESQVFQLTLQSIQNSRNGNPRFDVFNNTLPDAYAPGLKR